MIPKQRDVLKLVIATADYTLNEVILEIDPRYAVTVMIVSGGYPGDYNKGDIITGVDTAGNESILFHAGTKLDANGNLVTNGGRVMAVSSYGNSKDEALARSFGTIGKISFDGKNYRKDIGFDLK